MKKLLPIDRHSFTTYPLPESGEGVIEVTDEEFEGLMDFSLMISDDLRSVVPCPNPPVIQGGIPQE